MLLTAVASALGAIFLVPYQAAVAASDRAQATAAMLAAATVFNVAVAVWRRRGVERPAPGTWRVACALAALTIGGNLAVAYSLPQIGAGMTSVVMKAQVVLTPLLAWLTIRERVRPSLFVGIAFAVAGFAVMQYADVQGRLPFPGWGLLAALAFSGMLIVTRRFIPGRSATDINAIRLVIAVAILFALPEELGGARFAGGRALWINATIAGVLGPGISRLALMSALRYVTASLVALVGLIGPVFAFVVAYFVFGTMPTPTEVVGAALILAGVAWPVWRERARDQSVK